MMVMELFFIKIIMYVKRSDWFQEIEIGQCGVDS